MNPQLINGQRLFDQGRPKEAAEAFRDALSTEPSNWHAQSMLGLASLQAGDEATAMRAAAEGVRLSPGTAFSHYVLGLVYLQQGRVDQAEQAGREALRLRPDASYHYHLLAMIAADQKQYQQALDWIDRGLQVDPEDADCLNLRGQLLIRLKRRGEAAATAERALASSPDSAHSHANAGWTALHNNQPKQALDHFKESLRLEPGNDWAKAGLAEALKAKNPIYRVFLGFLLWMSRMDPRWRMGVIIGGYVVYRIGQSVSQSNPEIAPFLWPVLVAYMVFAWMTWIGVPLFDSMLRLSRYGRHALNDDQRRVSNALLGFIVLGVASYGGYLFTGVVLLKLAAIQLALLALITVGVLQMRRMARYKMLLAGCGTLGVFMAGSWLAGLAGQTELFNTFDRLFLFGFIGMMWFVALGGGGQARRDLA